MGKKKTTTTQTNNYAWKEQPVNQYYNQAAQHLNNIDLQTGVRNQFAQNENMIEESGNEFFGANTSAEQREKIKFGRKFANNMQKGAALSNAVQGENAARITGNMSLGAATAPVLTNTGGTNQTVSPYSVMDWTQMGVQAASTGATM